MKGNVVGLHVNPNGGVPKLPVEFLEVTFEGCIGDRQRDLRHHGGPKKAVCLLEHRVMEELQQEGHPIGPGSTGENILIAGLNAGVLAEGVCLRIGNVEVCITGDAPPCKTIRTSFLNETFTSLSHRQQRGKTRWYAEVLCEGTVHLGDEALVISEDEPVGSR